MSNNPEFCIVCCEKNKSLLIKTSTFDSFNTSWRSKLLFCVPEVEWKEDELICHFCTEQLQIAYTFRNQCLHHEKLIDNVQNYPKLSGSQFDFACSNCNAKFAKKTSLTVHIQEKHQTIDDTLACVKCNRIFKSPSVYQKHLKICRHKETNECEEKTGDDNNKTSENELAEKDESERSYSCDICSHLFVQVKTLMQHVVKEHDVDPKTIKPYKCDKCDRKFGSSTNLRQHMMYHNGSRSNMCSYCGKVFITKTDLRVHEKHHLNNRDYACDLCSKTFNTHKCLRSHKLIVHTDPSEWKHLCTVCNKRFPIKSNFDQHMRRHSGDKRFSCHFCSKRFVDKVVLQNHLVSHTNVRAFKCDVCQKEYKQKRVMEVHLAKAHNIGTVKIPVQKKKYFCHMCPMSYVSKSKLTRHLYFHAGEKPFACHLCNKAFRDKGYVKKHLLNAHNVSEGGF